MTGDLIESSAQSAGRGGPFWLQKPFRVSDVLALLRDVLSDAPARNSSEPLMLSLARVNTLDKLFFFFDDDATGLPFVDGSTPKSHTKRFIPSGRISASAYSPGGRGLPSVNRKTVGAISHRWIEIELRFSPAVLQKDS